MEVAICLLMYNIEVRTSARTGLCMYMSYISYTYIYRVVAVKKPRMCGGYRTALYQLKALFSKGTQAAGCKVLGTKDRTLVLCLYFVKAP